MAGGIFISYRRADAKHPAGRLVERLERTFSSDQLFLDIDNIDPGLDFKKVVSEKLQACKVLLVVIGPDWLSSSDERGARRLDNPKDFVRIEIETGLERDVRVIPVLVDGALMPMEEHLPDTLRPLAHRNAVRLEHERFGSDAEGLAKALAKIVTPVTSSGERGAAPTPATKPTQLPLLIRLLALVRLRWGVAGLAAASIFLAGQFLYTTAGRFLYTTVREASLTPNSPKEAISTLDTDCSIVVDSTPDLPQTKTFPCPTYAGHRLDFCYRFSVIGTCGQVAAIRFCNSQRYKTITDRAGFVIDPGIGDTISMGDNQVGGRDGFKFIRCVEPMSQEQNR